MHVTVDGRRASGPPPVWEGYLCTCFCRDAIDLADMKLIDGPHVVETVHDAYALAMLAESHVSVHLDGAAGLAHIDLFSCKDFDSEAFVQLCINTFNLRDVRDTVLERGL